MLIHATSTEHLILTAQTPAQAVFLLRAEEKLGEAACLNEIEDVTPDCPVRLHLRLAPDAQADDAE